MSGLGQLPASGEMGDLSCFISQENERGQTEPFTRSHPAMKARSHEL
jgi:hypothetical protein